MSFLRNISRAAKRTLKSKLTMSVLGGVAIVFPVVGVPALAAVAIANQTLNNVEKMKGGKEQLMKAFARTRVLAAKGHAPAIRAVKTFDLVIAARRADPVALAKLQKIKANFMTAQRVRAGTRLLSNGRIVRL